MMSEATRLPPLYGKLDTLQKEIRLLKLECHEGDDLAPIKCSLVKSRIDGGLPYEALSYVWGNSTDRVPLSINGHTLHITRNLDTALRHLRRLSIYRATADASSDPASVNLDRNIQLQSSLPSSDSRGSLVLKLRMPIVIRHIWIDAVCINQDDPQERSEQVKFMFDLYRYAARVLVWLGEAQDESNLAMNLVCQLQANQLDLLLKQYPQATLTRWEQDQLAKWSAQPPWFHSIIKLHGSSGGEHLNPQDPKEWVAFQRLMDRPWWQRVWVVQELVAGQRRAVVGCGSKWVPWSSFAVANTAIFKFKSNPMTLRLRRLASKSDLITELDAICLRAEARTLTRWAGIMLPLFYTLSKKATLPVDRIYALLGFLPDTAIVSDYMKPPEEVYRSFVRLTIRSTNLLAFLNFNRFPKNLNLPSWVPDFSCEFKEDEYNITVPRGVYGADGHQGHNSFVGSPGCGLRPSDGADELTVLGFVYDHPVHVARPWQAPLEERDSYLWQLAEEYEEALKVLEGRISKERLHEALWRTLIWNATPESTYPAPSEYGNEYVHVTKPRHVLIDTNKMMAGIYDPAQHQRIIPIIGLARKYYESLVKHSLNRRFFITSKGHLGSGPIEMRACDLVCVLIGFKTPVILRRASGDGFQWIGPAYVHGIMHGESLFDRTSIARIFKLK